jgi:diacylglycerol O-acyltransferase / trehalose O-mycolyltransferase / mycolyltransferase Ag85
VALAQAAVRPYRRALMRIRVVVVLCALLIGCSAAASSPPSPTASIATIGQPADDGARIVGVATLDARTRDLTIESPEVGTVMVRLLLPSGYADQPTTRFPVLYLLHGGGGKYTDWTANTDVEALTAPTRLLVVMPAAVTSGIADLATAGPQAGGSGGSTRWEAFHLTELRQLLERNWQAGEDRAIAGLSMGGFGTVTYAGRNPELFKAVASYSGALDLRGLTALVDDPRDLAHWGDLVTAAANWGLYDPVKLIPRLRGKAIYLSFGNGEPGPLDPGRTDVDELEQVIGAGNQSFVAALDDAGIPATVHAYGPGTHSWPYWGRELRLSLPLLLRALGETPTATSPS